MYGLQSGRKLVQVPPDSEAGFESGNSGNKSYKVVTESYLYSVTAIYACNNGLRDVLKGGSLSVCEGRCGREVMCAKNTGNGVACRTGGRRCQLAETKADRDILGES